MLRRTVGRSKQSPDGRLESAMGRPLVGITCGTTALDAGAANPQYRLNQSYARTLAMVGIAPVIVPNLADSALRAVWLDRLDGLLLSGGADVAPAIYGEAVLNETVKIDPARDEAELPLIREAAARDLPILAICRGIQALNVALGGTLIQDIPAELDTRIAHSQNEVRSAATHIVEIVPGSRIAGLVGESRMEVNSFHHQAISRLADGLVVSARAPDGVIEAVERPNARFLVGVQYHPEELVQPMEHARALFRGFAAMIASRVNG